MSDWPRWESAVEEFAGGHSAQDTAIWDTWQGLEGAGGLYNPLNTTVPVDTPYGRGTPAAGSWNVAGVLDYPNPQAGAWATVVAVQKNAPGFAAGLRLENPLDLPESQLVAGFNWLGGGSASPANIDYAQRIVEGARSRVGSPSTGASPGSTAPGQTAPGGQPAAAPAASQPAPGGGGGFIGCITGGGGSGSGCPPPDKPKSTLMTCDGCHDPNSNTGLDGFKCDCFWLETWASCYAQKRPVRSAVDAAAALGCLLSLDFLELLAGFLILIVGLSRITGVHVPYLPGAR